MYALFEIGFRIYWIIVDDVSLFSLLIIIIEQVCSFDFKFVFVNSTNRDISIDRRIAATNDAIEFEFYLRLNIFLMLRSRI